jgi:transposase
MPPGLGHTRHVLVDPRDARIAQLEAMVAQLLGRVAELEAKLASSSRNSSKPPSSDGPAVPSRPKKPPTGRKPGGQPGHERRVRRLEPSEKARTIVVCIPSRCERCNGRLHGRDRSPGRHQVFDLPQVEPHFDEYQLHALGCDCGHVTRGTLPVGVPTGAFGPGVVAVVALLMGVFRLSKRMVPNLMADLFNLRMSVGAVIGCQRHASEALAAPVEEAKTDVVKQPIKHADETGWHEGVQRSRAWLWAAVTTSVVVFMIHTRRNADAARALLVQAAGVLVSDRHGAYGWWPDRMRQFCWAHLKRDVQAIAERGGLSETVGAGLLEEIGRMFQWWHRVRDGSLTHRSFRVYMRPLRARFEAGLRLGALCDEHPKTKKTCENLLRHADALWTFVRIEGVEPTNNAAELVVRHPVLLRNVSYGTHSEAGSRFMERILTVHATLRRQERHILTFLRDACVARLHARSAPSLLPISEGRLQLTKAA